MKKLFLSVALLGLAASCKSQTTDVTDTSVAPEAACATACDSEMKAECSDMKAECSEQKVCPVTGKVMN